MWTAIINTCFGGILCMLEAPPTEFETRERCFHVAAIVSGQQIVDISLHGLPIEVTIECKAFGESESVSFNVHQES